jgi:hypothetical protein
VGDTLPNGSCDGSDKSILSGPGTGGDNGTVPEPTSLLLIGTGLLGLFGATRKKA